MIAFEYFSNTCKKVINILVKRWYGRKFLICTRYARKVSKSTTICHYSPFLRLHGLVTKLLRTKINLNFIYIYTQDKAVRLQAWSGREGSRKLKFPDYMTTAQDT